MATTATTYSAPVLDVSAITPQMCREAGINPYKLQQQLRYASTVPVTQEDRDRLGEVRNERLKRIKKVAIPSLVISVSAMIVGVIMISLSTDLPYIFNGGLAAGVICFFLAGMSIMMIKEGRKTPTGDKTTSRMQTLVIVHMMLGCLLMGVAGVSWGMSGLWGTLVCLRENRDSGYSVVTCPSDTLLAVSILTLIIVPVLLVLFLITCSSYSCSNARAFGIKSGYEKLLELQMANNARLLAIQQYEQSPQQEQQQQQQQPVNMYGGQPTSDGSQITPPQQYQQQYPGNRYSLVQQGQQGAYPQPQTSPQPNPQSSPYRQHSPSGPPVEGFDADAPPPSYTDVMKQENMANFHVSDPSPV